MTEYQNELSHKDIKSWKCKCDNMENMEAYSKELELGKKKVKITLEFPYTADKKNAERFERNLRQIYLNKIIQTVSIQKSPSVSESSLQAGKKMSTGGRNDE